MITLYQLTLGLHVISGALALCIFWVPVLMRKGGIDHKTFGRYYSVCMYTVALSGLVMSTFLIILPAVVMPQFAGEPARLEQLRIFAWLLTHLAILIWVSVLYGRRVLAAKAERQRLKQPLLLSLLALLTLNGLVLLIFGAWHGMVLQMAFGTLGMVFGGANLAYIYRAKVQPNSWVTEHLGAYIGSGIGAYTAFLVFGARQFFTLSNDWMLALWIAPGVLGTLLISWASRKYAPRAPKPKERL